MLVSGGRVKFATEDHKPTNESEQRRILVRSWPASHDSSSRMLRAQEAGGFLQIGRVCGNLAVSRALGDFSFKDAPHLPENAQKVSAEADLTILQREVMHMHCHCVLTSACISAQRRVLDPGLRRHLGRVHCRDGPRLHHRPAQGMASCMVHCVMTRGRAGWAVGAAGV